MKILQVSPKIPFPPKDGGAMAVLNLSLGLAEEGNEMHMLCINTPKHFYHSDIIPDKIKQHVKIHAVFVNTNISPVKLLLNFFFSQQPYIAKRFYNKSFILAIKALLEKEDFDIVQLEGAYLMQYVPVIRKTSKAHISMRAHNVEFEIWKRKAENEKQIFKKFYFKTLAKRIEKFERRCINQYDLLLPITKRDANFFASAGNKKPMQVIPFGLAYREKKLVIQEQKSLFYFGSLDWIPNQEGLMWFLDNVWGEIKEKHPDLILRIAGRNAPPWLKKALLNQPVEYSGEIENAENYLQHNTIMVAPLFSGSGIRVKIIEAMSYGKVIITSALGAEGINFINKKHLFIANTKQEYIHTIEYLLKNPKIIETTGKNAKLLAKQNFDIFAISLKLTEFYNAHCKS